MLKREEVSDPNSCWNKAEDDEPVFVLLGRDAAAVRTVLVWITCRIDRDKNEPMDAQIQEAYRWCDQSVAWRESRAGITSPDEDLKVERLAVLEQD